MPLATSVRGFEIALLSLVLASSIGIGYRDVGSAPSSQQRGPEAASELAKGGAGLTSSLAASPDGGAAVRRRADARARIEALRARFRITPAAAPAHPRRLAMDSKPMPVLGAGVVGCFETNGAKALRAVISAEAKRGIQRPASIELPRRANGSVHLEDDTSHVSVRFALQGANDAPVAVADGMALYAGALGGADVVHRVHAEGTEDYVVFDEKPAREEIAYDVDVSRAAGLRLVNNTLEFLDERGSPRLRIAPPYVVDARGERHAATLTVENCAYDVNPAAPRGREVRRPGAGSCEVDVAWGGDVAYPAIVDPSWTATGSMATRRYRHTTRLTGPPCDDGDDGGSGGGDRDQTGTSSNAGGADAGGAPRAEPDRTTLGGKGCSASGRGARGDAARWLVLGVALAFRRRAKRATAPRPGETALPRALPWRRFGITLVSLVVASSIGVGCHDVGSAPSSRQRGSLDPASDIPKENTGLTRARIEALRQRFRVMPVAAPARPGRPAMAPKPVPVLGAGLVSRFETNGATALRAVIPVAVKRRIQRPASVELPQRANGSARLEDDTSHVSVRFALRGANDAPVAVADGMALYAGGLGGADVVHRVHAEGTEDYVAFDEKPAREEIAYDVDVSRAAGLRLVGNTLEFLDERGSPQLRIAPPSVMDARGARHVATLAVDGCAYDANPAAPWGREVTRPGAASCEVRVAWGGGVTYPALVDPSWTATGSMAAGRWGHTASVLASGMVLVAGGSVRRGVDAELYDPASGTFATTGSMTTWRHGHMASVLASGKVLIAGGEGYGPSPVGFTSLASAELYDPASGRFEATDSMTTTRDDHTASVLASGKVLIAGGYTHQFIVGLPLSIQPRDVMLASVELYDPASGRFVESSPMTVPRYRHTASVLTSGKVLVAGGNDEHMNAQASAELYDPASGGFTRTGSMKTTREWHTASVLGSGMVLVAGGQGGQWGLEDLASAELYYPAIGRFFATGSMTAPRLAHTASVLASGMVLVAGGGLVLSSASAELYDPASGSFAPTASLTMDRFRHTASVLASGKVLVAGGGMDDESSAEPFAICDCASTEYCHGSCLPKQTTGASCTAADQCLSGFCVDAVCCDRACSGTCEACSATKKGSGADGTCSSVAAETDPDNECPTEPTSTCGSTGSCNGAGACEKYSNTVICSPAACSGNVVMLPKRCDGNGACVGGGTQVCTDSPCIGGACASPCMIDTDCGDPAYYCKASVCTTKASDGSACDVDHECLSGFCVDGVCCESACSGGVCDACSKQAGSLADGICTLFTDSWCDDGNACTLIDTCQQGACVGSEPVTCAARDACHDVGVCDVATGRCRARAKPDGSPCSEEGQPGTCIDGVCTLSGSGCDSSASGVSGSWGGSQTQAGCFRGAAGGDAGGVPHVEPDGATIGGGGCSASGRGARQDAAPWLVLGLALAFRRRAKRTTAPRSGATATPRAWARNVSPEPLRRGGERLASATRHVEWPARYTRRGMVR